jgi:hypothetical protein
VDNFVPLETLDWQVHVYGEARPALTEACGRRGVLLHAFPWQRAAQRAGLRRGAAYLVRPDGYVALADPASNPARLEAYLDRWALRPR